MTESLAVKFTLVCIGFMATATVIDWHDIATNTGRQEYERCTALCSLEDSSEFMSRCFNGCFSAGNHRRQ